MKAAAQATPLGWGGLEHAPESHGSQNSLKIGVVKPQYPLFLISYSFFRNIFIVVYSEIFLKKE